MSETPKEKLSRAREIACRDMSWQLSCADASAIRYVLSEMDRLQAIAALLPTDAEGNPLFVGMRRWVSDSDARGKFSGWETITQLRQRPNGEWEVFCTTCDTTPGCCWGSIGAEEKARQV